MYLLILVAAAVLAAVSSFTSHYVSINSSHLLRPEALHSHLHPTMYLLILLQYQHQH